MIVYNIILLTIGYLKLNDYTLDIKQEGDYLYAYYEAEKDSVSLSNELWKEISLKMKELDVSKLLVVENIKKNPGSVLEIYSIVNAAVRFGFAGKTIAFVDLIEEHYKANKFGENIANNLGVNGKIFKTVDDAKNWIKDQ